MNNKVTPVAGTKVEATKAVEVKPVVKAEEVKPVAKAEEVKPVAKEEVKVEAEAKKRGRKSKAEIEELKAAGKYTEKKTTKKAAKKTTAKKVAEKKTNVVVQWFGKSVTEEEIIANVKAAYVAETGKKESSIKVLDVYVKPEENAAYYVVDSKFQGRVDL